MHGLIETQAFDVRIVETGEAGLRHLFRVVKTFKGHVLGLGPWLNEFQHRAQRIADPGYDDGPALDATVAVDAFFKWGEFQYFVQGKLARGLDVSFYGYSPG